LVRTAVGKGVITTGDGVYRFGSYTLGVDENSTIGKLVNEKEVLEMIESRIGFLDSEKEEAKASAPPPVQEQEPELTMADLNKYTKPKRPQQ